jgi:hypothetical protein
MPATSEIDPWANESKPTLRYLSKRSGKPESDCLVAIRAVNGDIPNALRHLAPGLTIFKFPDWYYPIGCKPVDDPDRDLPFPSMEYDWSFEWEIDNDRMDGGERLIAPFNDSNSLSDILGCIAITSAYPDSCPPELRAIGSLQTSLAKAADRIREKLRRNRNPIRASFFEDAIRHVEAAKDYYFDREYTKGRETLWSAERLLREGNKPLK